MSVQQGPGPWIAWCDDCHHPMGQHDERIRTVGVAPCSTCHLCVAVTEDSHDPEPDDVGVCPECGYGDAEGPRGLARHDEHCTDEAYEKAAEHLMAVTIVDTDSMDGIYVFAEERDADAFAATYSEPRVYVADIIRHELAQEMILERIEGKEELDDHEVLDRIVAVMSGSEWNADVMDAVARIVRETGRKIADVGEGVQLVCDQCYEAAIDSRAVCEDLCSLPLDHDGRCDIAQASNAQRTCDRCGEVDRLHEIDPTEYPGADERDVEGM